MRCIQNYKLIFYSGILLAFSIISCQKEIKFTSSYAPVKQVINCNFTPYNSLNVNISKSKTPNDFNSVEFLNDCKVDLYENNVFVETMRYKLKDTLSGLGWYVSTYKLKPAKSYKIISEHPTLGIASAEEFLPSRPLFTANLLQHADSINPTRSGKFSITFTDSSQFKNYYFIGVYYKILKPIVDTLGDTTYKVDYNFNIVSVSNDAPNPANFNRTFFTDDNFDGQTKTIIFDFNSLYNTTYKSIEMIIEFSDIGYNFYSWTTQQIKPPSNNLNEGADEPFNLVSNIKNGYGHFSSFSSSYVTFKLR